MIGLAVGDALGATNEFKRLPSPSFPKLLDGPLRDILGGGPHGVRPGQVTDDTQMACCLAASLRAAQGFSPDEVALRYRAWKPHAFDIGGLTSAALEALDAGMPVDRAGLHVWLQSGRKSAGNGSLMRTAPIGVFFAWDPAERTRASLQDSAITHFDPRCQLACAAFNGALAHAVSTRAPLKAEGLLKAAGTALNLAAAQLARSAREYVREIEEASRSLKEDLAFARKEDPELYGPELQFFAQMGFVRVAFRLAFWELCHAPSFEAALIDVANRGGDSDTNAAITGALLGAFYGDEAIPRLWSAAVLGTVEGVRGPLADTYHPRQLLWLVED